MTTLWILPEPKVIPRWYHQATLAAINMHLDARIWHRLEKLNVTKQQLITMLLSQEADHRAA